MAAVSLSGTRKSFGATEVIRGIDLNIPEGEFCVLLGPSGCGKSTLLRLIAGLEEVSFGRIHIAGRDVTELPPKQRDVAMVFQSYALYPHMSVYDNMAFGLKLGRVSRTEIRSRVDAAARSLHIEHLLDRKPAELSGGQRQRVAIGRAIVREPRVFLFDEPLSNLDADLRVRMRLEFSELHRRLGATMIYVTHDQVEAMTLADRLVIINQGRLVQAGPPLELYRRPRDLFVAGFLGSPRINLLPGRIEDFTPDGVRVAIADGQHIQIAAGGNGAAAGADITVGIRPEHLCLDGAADNTLKGTATAVEHLGDHALVYIEWQGGRTPLVARTAADRGINPGQAVQVGFAALACHLFDAAGLAFPQRVGDTGAPRNHSHHRR